MKKLLLLSFVALLGAAIVRAEPTRANLVERIETCEAILQEFQTRASLRPAPEAWRSAKAILILNQFKGGFIFGLQDGYGVLMVKRPDGRWSLPVLVNAGEASIGFQVGAKSVESLYIITDASTPQKFFSNRFNIGVDAKAVAGPKAAETERNNKDILAAPMLAYNKIVGLYAGATVKAGHISRNDKANFELYTTNYTMPELLYSDWVQPPKEVQPLMALIQKLAP